ncbi:MAG: hypothetical protein Q8M92_01035 [Candidatus Subteraquimicrobiales bacterium]|nr:hypothetical protein [Candidatus Subteraquimicrobiales bacterium]
MSKKIAIISNGLEGGSITTEVELSETPLDVIKRILKDDDLAKTFTNDEGTRQQMLSETFDKNASRFAVQLPSGTVQKLEWEESLSSQLPKELHNAEEIDFIITLAGVVGNKKEGNVR